MLSRGAVLLALAGCRFHFAEQPDGDARMPDASGSCAQPSILCDDFSTMPTGTSFGDVQWLASGGREGGGLQVHGLTGSPSGLFYSFPAVTSGPLHVRAEVRIHGGAPAQSFVVLVELNNGNSMGGVQKVSADIVGGNVWSIGSPFAIGGPSSLVATRDVWTCVELVVVDDSTMGEMHLSVAGTEAVGFTMKNTAIPSGYQQLILVSGPSPSDPDTTVDFDDLVLARAPIGC